MGNYIANNQEAVIEYLNGLSDSELVATHNTYCDNINDMDSQIFSNDDEFFNMFFDGKVLEAVRAVSYGEYKPHEDWIKFNGYGNLDTTNYPNELIDINSIADDILERPENYDIEFED